MAAWYDKAIFYHIYPLGLCGCSMENDYQMKESKFDRLNLWVEHMASIGCNAVYIGPIFESGSHGYDTADYKKIDSRLGSNEDFKNWVALCHARGIKVVVDGVFNHTGRDFFAFQNLQKDLWNSWGKDWYCHVDFGQSSPYGDKFSYESWRGYAMLPRLNMQNQAVRDYMLDVVRFWVDTFDIDGIRLDCADVLDFGFMEQLRALADGIKPEFWLMGEVIHGDYGRWVKPSMLHSVTNYELHKGIYSAHNSHNYFEMAHTIQRLFGPYGLCRGAKLYNFVDNHDVDRIYHKLTDKKNLFPVYAFLYTIVGIPSIYYGSEWGIEGEKCGGSDDMLRPAIDIQSFQNPHPDLTEWITKLAAVKRENDELSLGEYKELVLTNKQYAYGRVLGSEACVTVLNNDSEAYEMHVPMPVQASQAKELLNGLPVTICGDKLHITIPGNSAAIIKLCQ